jgi:hypothetical protein
VVRAAGAVPVEKREVVFLAGFLPTLVASAFTFYAYGFAGPAALIGVVGWVAACVLSSLTVYDSRGAYLVGVGLGLAGGYFGYPIISKLFGLLAQAGLLAARFVAFATTPRDYAALALMVGLVGAVQYALMFALYSIVVSLFVSSLGVLYRYPDLLLLLGMVAMYPFYVVYVYMFAWFFLVIVLVGAVASFWLASFATAALGALAFVEILLAVAGVGWFLPRVFSEAMGYAGGALLDLYGLPYEPAELDATMRNNMFMFILYSIMASVSGIVSGLYMQYAAMYMVAMFVAALGTWGTFVVVPLSFARRGRVSWRIVRRVITSGLAAVAMICVALLVGYTHASLAVSEAGRDFVVWLGPAVRQFIGDVIKWIMGG